MRPATHGDTVARDHYRGKLQDGSVFDATDREPLPFTIGGGQLIPGFEEAVVGMNPGDSRTGGATGRKSFWALPGRYGRRGP